MTYLKLAYIFFKTGLFTIGGGLAALPLLHEETVGRGLVSETEFYDMLAISQSTPGPIGINFATYIGYNQASYLGAITATLAMVTPSIIIIYLIAKFVRDFNEKAVVRRSMRGFRPTAVGLIATAAYYIIIQSIIPKSTDAASFLTQHNISQLAIFGVCAYTFFRFKLHPVFCIATAAIAGMIFL